VNRDGGTGKRPARLRPYLSTLLGNDRRRLVWVVTVQVVAALSQGLGLLLLVPLLAVAGVSKTSSTGGVVAWTRHAFGMIGVPLSLESMLIAYAVVVAIAAGLNAYQQVLSTRYRLEFVDDLRSRLYGSIARAEWRHLLTVRQSDLLTALTADVVWISQGTVAALALGATSVVIAAQVAVALRISPTMTALAAGTGLVLTVVVWPLVLRSRRLGEELVGHNHTLLASMTGFFDGLKLARAHGLEASHVQGFDDAMGRVRRSQIAFAKAQAAANAVQLIVSGIILAVLVDIAINVLGMALAELLVLAFIFTRLVPQITAAQKWVQELAQALPHFDAVTSVIEECDRAAESQSPQPSVRQPRLTLQQGLRFEDVSFAYHPPDGAPADVLRGVTFELPARMTTALVGPSGAGKTTIADLAVGLLVPTSGQVLIDGAALTGDLVGRWREAVAMVPQEPFLFHDSVRANLLWAQPMADEDELWQALRVAAAEDFVRRLPHGLDTVVGDRGGRMSGGERQRIALARAVLRKPELLVLDEATTSLDADNENAILDALAALHGQMTVLVISHQRTTLRNADRIVRLDGGRVVDLASL
jgi:ATP-binding cassette subfamily C protein